MDPIMYGGDAGAVFPTNEQRASYNEVLALFSKMAPRGTKLAILPSELRSEVELPITGATVNAVEFLLRTDSVNTPNGRMRATENRLDNNDAFVVREMGVLFGLQESGANDVNTSLHTFGNPTVFGTAAPSVEAAYNAQLSAERNTVRYLDRIGIMPCRRVDSAQQGLAVSTAASNNAMFASKWDGSSGMIPIVPQFAFSGADKVSFDLNLMQPLNFQVAAAPSTAKVVATLVLRGLKVQNGAMYRTPNV